VAITGSFCVWSIAHSDGQVTRVSATGIIREYLKFILELGWEPSEVYHGPGGNGVQGLDSVAGLVRRRTAAAIRGRFR
jgi:hypothetical protein